MKSGVTLFALFLLCAFTTHLPSASAWVLDTDGNVLVNRGRYYVLQAVTLNGGGLEYAATGNETCPLTVVGSPFHTDHGYPVIISSPLLFTHISEGILVYFGYASAPSCAPHSFWWTVVKGLQEGLAVKLEYYSNLVLGGFNIVKASVADFGYNILFCPFEEGTVSECKYVQISSDDKGNRALVLSDSEENAIWVVFKKVSTA